MKMIPHSMPTIEKDDIEAINSVLKSKMIASGGLVKEFEERICKYIGGLRAIATSSGKSALILALKIIGIKSEDEVILPTYVCRSVIDAIRFIGAKPIIVDIGEDYCISAEKIKEHISSQTKAIIVVHIFGISAPIKEIIEVANEYNLYIIENCAQAIGGEKDGKKLGSFGDFSMFSFQATKMMTTGEGGILVINNEKFLQKERINKLLFPMSDLQAALGLNQLSKLDKFIVKRKKLAERYIEILKNVPWIDIPIRNMSDSIFFRFPIRIKKEYSFDSLRQKMESFGIHIRKGVDLMLHQIDKNFKCPKADLLFKETVSLPIYPQLSYIEVENVVNKLLKAL